MLLAENTLIIMRWNTFIS